MKRMKSSIISGIIGLAALVAMSASPAQAAFVVGGENGWQMSFDGMINIFAVYTMVGTSQTKDGVPVVISGITGANASQSFRDRTGLLPSIFAFNVKSPTINGVDYAARIGLYPQVQNFGTRTGFGPDTAGGSRLDIHEVFFTADSCFGQLLAGRALNLFQGKNILTDMTLMGVGVPLELTGGGTTLGRIGYGYTYPSFGSQFRYTTPDMSGLKVAFAVADPSQITSSGAYTASKTNQPRFETELSYAKNLTGGKIQAWLSGLYQQAQHEPAGVTTKKKVSSIGGAAGVQAGFGPVEVVVSGFGGQALGLTLTQDDVDALGAAPLDATVKPRITYGGLAQVTYTIGKVKLGAQYGINYADRTDDDYTQIAAGTAVKKSQQAATGMVTYSVNKYLQVVGEYSWARQNWYTGDVRQDLNVISLGTIFTW